jgi:hypothetical protein
MAVLDHDMMMFEQNALLEIEYIAAIDYRNAHGNCPDLLT